MIAKAKSISHGINALNYMSGASFNKKHPERIHRVLDQHLPPFLDALGIWNAIKQTTMNNPRMRKNVIRIEISPSAEHTRNFTTDDWRDLWNDFVREFDRIEIKDKKGRIISGKTNIAGSKASVWLHEEARSGIPHLHAAVCRIDENGRTNNDHKIHLRAQRAAEKVALKRGWQTAADVREVSKSRVTSDCMDVLRQLDPWSFESYFYALKRKGYDVHVRKDTAGIIRGYVLRKGNVRYKASELGKGRNLMATSLENTWNRLHDGTAQHERGGENEIFTRPDYTSYSPGTMRVEFSRGNETYTRFIPEGVMRVFDDEFDYREVENWADLINEACYHFAVAMSFMAFLNVPTYVSGGGGGSADNDLPKKRDDLEEEIVRARRCANAARAKIGIVKRKGFKR